LPRTMRRAARGQIHRDCGQPQTGKIDGKLNPGGCFWPRIQPMRASPSCPLTASREPGQRSGNVFRKWSTCIRPSNNLFHSRPMPRISRILAPWRADSEAGLKAYHQREADGVMFQLRPRPALFHLHPRPFSGKFPSKRRRFLYVHLSLQCGGSLQGDLHGRNELAHNRFGVGHI
jgi:hypothetical protein